MQDSCDNSSLQDTGKNLKKPYLVIIVLAAVITILALCFAIYFYLNAGMKKQQRDILEAKSSFVNENNLDEVKEKMEEPVTDNYYKVKMSFDWTFSNGGKTSEDVYVANSEDNTRTVYFDLTLAENNELLYTSPYMLLGSELKNIELEQKLEAGDYDAVVTYHLVDDDYEEVTSVSVSVKLHILES